MSGGASILALPEPSEEQEVVRKKQDLKGLKEFYKKKKEEEEEEKKKKKKEEGGAIPPTPLNTNRGSY